MEYSALILASFFASMLSFFSGFGLGTILMPVFAVFLPLEIAVAFTAIVHFLNNLFKFVLIGREANKKVMFQFGIPAIVFSYSGAILLAKIAQEHVLTTYEILGREFHVTWLGLLIGFLMLMFTWIEIKWDKEGVSPKYLPLGGALSGFFGGFSGHQGAFRSLFLLRAGLTKEAYIATGVVISVMVDTVRIFAYSKNFQATTLQEYSHFLMVAVVAALSGAFVGRKLLYHMKNSSVHSWVAGLVAIMAVLIGAGIV